MDQQQHDLGDRRGLRFSIDASATVVPEGHSAAIPARVTELSFRGCFLELPSTLKEKQRVHVKLSHSGESFEADAQVIYVTPAGVGVIFAEMEPQSRNVLQTWILAALDKQAKSQHS